MTDAAGDDWPVETWLFRRAARQIADPAPGLLAELAVARPLVELSSGLPQLAESPFAAVVDVVPAAAGLTEEGLGISGGAAAARAGRPAARGRRATPTSPEPPTRRPQSAIAVTQAGRVREVARADSAVGSGPLPPRVGMPDGRDRAPAARTGGVRERTSRPRRPAATEALGVPPAAREHAEVAARRSRRAGREPPHVPAAPAAADRETAELLSLLGEAARRLEHERRSESAPASRAGSTDDAVDHSSASPPHEPLASPGPSSPLLYEPTAGLLDTLATRVIAAAASGAPASTAGAFGPAAASGSVPAEHPAGLRPLPPAAVRGPRAAAARVATGDDVVARSALAADGASRDAGPMQRGRDDAPSTRSDGGPGAAAARGGAFAAVAAAAAGERGARAAAAGRAAATGGVPASLLPLDVAETAALDAGRLAALVNEAFQEQARRHGVDLS